ncbi:MAG: YbaN family protein [Actinomycetota bacterium]
MSDDGGASTASPLPTSPPSRSLVARVLWGAFGLAAVGIGSLGTVVPGLPTTVFFIIAAWAFSKSSRRLERWVLGLPKIGPMVQDHRDGLGMPRRAKWVAGSMIVLFVTISVLLVEPWWLRAVIAATGAVGVGYIWLRVPTKETVIAQREAHA